MDLRFVQKFQYVIIFLDYSNMFIVQNDFSVSSEGTIFAQTYDYKIKVSTYNSSTGELKAGKILSYSTPINGISFSPNSNFLYCNEAIGDIYQYRIVDSYNSISLKLDYTWGSLNTSPMYNLKKTIHNEINI